MEREWSKKCVLCKSGKTVTFLVLEKKNIVQTISCKSCGKIKQIQDIPLWTKSNKYRYLFANGKTFLMHRWVYEHIHNCILQSWESVHHRDCMKSNNLPSNLIVPEKHSPKLHKAHHIYKINYLRNRVKQLEGKLSKYGNEKVTTD